MNPAPLSLVLLSLLLAVPLTVAGQTNATDASTPATHAPASDTTVPATPLPPIDLAPSSPSASTPPSIPDAPAPPPTSSQVYPQASPGQANGVQQEEIEDIRPPFFFLHSWFWLWIALAAAAILALLLLLWNRFRSQRLLSAKSAFELTLEKLEKARTMLREDNPMPYAVFVSETVRNYLGQRFQAPSTRRTTDEFLRLMERDSNTPLAEHRDLLRHFLQSCDLVKFARYQPTLQELEDVQQRAWNFVLATKPLPAHHNGNHP